MAVTELVLLFVLAVSALEALYCAWLLISLHEKRRNAEKQLGDLLRQYSEWLDE